MIPTFVIIITVIILLILIERYVNKKFYQEIKVPNYIEKEELFVDAKSKEIRNKTFFEVPGCGKFNSSKEAIIGARKCVLNLGKEVGVNK